MAEDREELTGRIAASARRALQGQMPASLREYSFSFDRAAKHIMFKAEVEPALTEDDLLAAESEVYADFADDTQVETSIEVVPADLPLRPLPGGVVFLRSGERAPEAA